jgi:LuxR family maltose regulon positive regulatory protein
MSHFQAGPLPLSDSIMPARSRVCTHLYWTNAQPALCGLPGSRPAGAWLLPSIVIVFREGFQTERKFLSRINVFLASKISLTHFLPFALNLSYNRDIEANKPIGGQMTFSLLSTKFYIPPQRTDSVLRPRLVEKLQAAVEHPRTFTLLSGPAGSGKTTLLSQFVAGLDRPVAWLSLDEADDDPSRFWTYLLAACQRIIPHLGEAALPLLSNTQSLPEDTVPTILINDLVASDAVLVLIIDDYHLVQDSVIHDSLLFLLEHQPDNLRLVLSTRTDPPWPLARYRARNRLVEIRARDLRFNRDETLAFLNQTMRLRLSAHDVAALEARTEGWIAGLQLAAIAMKSSPVGRDPATFVQAFSGSHLYVAEYLLEEVLRQHPQEVRSFLLETSILERLHASLCDAATGRTDGQTMLATLHQANLFLVRLDAEGLWFRYHHLFADLLQTHLQQTYPPEKIAEIHVRAAHWFDQNDHYVEAIHHALAAKDAEKAADLVNEHGQQVFYAGRYNMLRKWLNAVSKEYFRTYPRLEIYQLLLDLLEGTLDMYEDTLVEKEKLIQALPSSPQNNRLRQRALIDLSLFLAFQNPSKAIQIVEETLAEIPKEDLHTLAYLHSVLYRAYGMKGDHEKSSAAFRESFRLAEITRQYDLISNTTKVRAFELCYYGDLDEAIQYCQKIIDLDKQNGEKVFYPAGPCFIGLAAIHLERNNLEKADELLTRGVSLSEKGAVYGLFNGSVLKVRLLQAQGDLQEALKALQVLEQTFQRREFSLMAQKVSLFLAAGEITAASELEPEILEILGTSHYAKKLPVVAAEAYKLCLARIYIAQDQVEKAYQMLGEVESTAEPGLRFGRLMEAYILRAKARNIQSSYPVDSQAVDYMIRAVELAIEPGFMTLFLEEGPELVPILTAVADHEYSSDQVMKYARGLLQAFAERGQELPGRSILTSDQLREQLTPREMEVLQLIAAGHSNRAIADQLFIAVRTVKKHASNIYGKLGVGSRTQAVVRARELGLLRD